MKVLDHSSHWRSWKQVGQFVECEKCNVLLYEGDAPNNTKRILMEVLSRENLDMPVLDERADMPNTTNQPPNRNMRVAAPPVEENYESDLNYDITVADEEAALASATNGKTVAMPKDIGSSEVNVMGAFVEITSTFGRTIADPGNDRFGSVTAGLSVKEMFPGEMSAMDIANIAEGHYIITKEKVLSQLQLPFQQDQATGMILEVFPGARTVSSTPAASNQLTENRYLAEPAPAPAQAPAARFGTSAPAQGQQASRGPRSGARAVWEPAPSQAELKRELLEYPDTWYWDQNKSNATGPDFISTHYQNDRGYPAGIWIEGNRGPNFTPDELDTLNTMSDTDFCQTKPRVPR